LADIANKGVTKHGNPNWLPGKSGNPKGRPKDGESWAGIIREISNMTAGEVIELVGDKNDLGKAFKQMPKNVQMKKLITARVMAALMFDPGSGLWNALMERAEGKVPDVHEIDGNMTLNIPGLQGTLKRIYDSSNGAQTDQDQS
jgi:hypothetical protein